jgi:hypothetical protein
MKKKGEKRKNYIKFKKDKKDVGLYLCYLYLGSEKKFI